MKTKIRTFIAFIALGVIGFTNINATVDNKNMVSNAVVIEEEEEVLTLESWMTDNDYWISQEVADTTESDDSLRIESWMTNESLWK
ncbi:MAG: hypothetical protein JNL03_07980 [Prolixibacteraceae bacterium]|nr:hypothetical protein [Prolixibacteraceae bacterium]